MKRTLIALFALASTAMGAYTIDLTQQGKECTTYDDVVSADGITAIQVYNNKANEWHCSYQNASLDNQSTVENSVLFLQLGNAAALNKGNFAAIKIDMPNQTDYAITLSFDVGYGTKWGGDSSAFAADYHCNVYGYTADGTATKIGSWTTSVTRSTVAAFEARSVTIDLATPEDTFFTSYGVIFDATKTVGAAGGFGLKFTNVTMTIVPEPTTATLSLLALAGLAARRRRK